MIQIRCFEESHESDLEDSVNDFLKELDVSQFVDLKYSSSHFFDHDQQIYSFSACVIYRMNSKKEGKIKAGRTK